MRNLLWVALLAACSGRSDPDAPTNPGDDGDLSDTPPDVEHDLDHDGVWAEEGDCDDEDYAVHPGADELCNGIDDNCDDVIDTDAIDGSPFYTDADGDGFGDPATEVFACEGTISQGGDCDDTEPAVGPGFPAVLCDGFDNDCDPGTQEPGAVTIKGVPQPDLTTALDAAINGDIIELCEGTYFLAETALLVSITIEGPGDPTVTNIASLGSGAVFHVTRPATFAGVTIRGGTGHEVSRGETAGGGVYVADGGTLTLQNAVITGNTAGYGGGVWLGEGAVLDATDSEISGNTGDPQGAYIQNEGGGVYASANAQVLLANSAIEDNQADICGGVSLYAGSQIVGSGSATLSRNVSTSLSGGGGCTSGGATVSGLEIADNSSSNSGGGLTVSGGLVASDSSFLRNFATLVGGGMAATGDLDLTRVTFDSNRGDNDVGALDFAFDTATLTDCVLTSNSGYFFTGGVALFGAQLVSINTDWGDGAVDNLPDDLRLVQEGTTLDFAGVSDFTCSDPGGCI